MATSVPVSEVKSNTRENRTAAHSHIKGLGLKGPDGRADGPGLGAEIHRAVEVVEGHAGEDAAIRQADRGRHRFGSVGPPAAHLLHRGVEKVLISIHPTSLPRMADLPMGRFGRRHLRLEAGSSSVVPRAESVRSAGPTTAVVG